MRLVTACAWFAAVALFITACSEKKKEHEDHDSGSPINVTVSSYADGVQQIGVHSGEIGEMINSGKLANVHREAEAIQKIAQKLPELAKDRPAAMLKEINLTSKALADLYGEIDQAADAGNKDKTVTVHLRMKELIETLKKHVH